MVAHAQGIVACIVKEHLFVKRVGAVAGVGQPEVLPNHDAILVASLIKLFVASHAHPVTYHVKVHVAVILHGNVILATTIQEVLLAEAPVSA